jgi:predicted transcriptional regulator
LESEVHPEYLGQISDTTVYGHRLSADEILHEYRKPTNRNRDKFELIRAVLLELNKESPRMRTKTKVMYSAMLSGNQARHYFNLLVDKGLIDYRLSEQLDIHAGLRTIYEMTIKGRELLDALENFHRLYPFLDDRSVRS